MVKNQLIATVCNLSQGKRYLLSGATLAFFCFAFYMYKSRLDKKINFYTQEIATLKNKAASLDATKLLGQASQLQKSLTQNLLTKNNTNDRLFLNLTQSSGLKITSYLPEESGKQDYCKTKYKLALNGSFDDVVKFFTQLAEVKTTLKCCNLKFTNQDGTVYIDSTYNCYLAYEKNN